MKRLTYVTQSHKLEKSQSRLMRTLWFIILVIVLMSIFTLSEFSIVQATSIQGSSSSTIHGQVVDAVTQQPIENAIIVITKTIIVGTGKTAQSITEEIARTKTSVNGSYLVVVDGGFLYDIYVYYDDPSSPGVDYIPKLRSIQVDKGKEVNTKFEMTPGATVIVIGDLLIVDSAKPQTSWIFTEVLGGNLQGGNGSILTYGPSVNSQNSRINVNSTQVIVPVNTSFKIAVTTTTNLAFIIDDLRFSFIKKGEVVKVELAKYTLPYNLKLTNDSILFSENLVAKADKQGFYVLSEKKDLAESYILIKNATKEFDNGHYTNSYTDLRQAYVKALYVTTTIQTIYSDASLSVPLIIIFLAANSIVLSYLFLNT